VAVDLAMSQATELKELAARLAGDEGVDRDVRVALTEALGAR
jgi:hypothetical protein